MKDCSYCKWSNPQLPCHCFILHKILSEKEYWSDNVCKYYRDKFKDEGESTSESGIEKEITI